MSKATLTVILETAGGTELLPEVQTVELRAQVEVEFDHMLEMAKATLAMGRSFSGRIGKMNHDFPRLPLDVDQSDNRAMGRGSEGHAESGEQGAGAGAKQ